MKLEKLFYFPLLHRASLEKKKKKKKAEKDFSDVATLHFQNYSSCDALVAKSLFSAQSLMEAAPPEGGGQGLLVDQMRPRRGHRGRRTWETADPGPPVGRRTCQEAAPSQETKHPHGNHRLMFPAPELTPPHPQWHWSTCFPGCALISELRL